MSGPLRLLSLTKLATLNLVAVLGVFALHSHDVFVRGNTSPAAFNLSLAIAVLGTVALIIWLIARRMAKIIGATASSQVLSLSTLDAELSQQRDHREELVRQRTADLARARDQALQASHAKSAFLANMSHELRTPLNAIIGYSEMLKEDALSVGHSQYLEDLQRINVSGKHLLALINDILDLSKVESGRMQLHLEEFPLRSLIDGVLLNLEPLLQKNRNRLVTTLSESLGTVSADPVKVRQIVLNLLSNAAKFTQAGTITVQAERYSHLGIDWIRISVADTGIGMSPELVSRLFKEFTQGDSSSTRKYEGTGLGLAISRRFAEMMGGDITVTSELGRGSTFALRLPAAVIGPKVDPATVRFAPDPGGYYKRRKKISTVLVIDDDPFARDLLERFLSREGFEALLAEDGNVGLKLAQEKQPDVIILDVQMPQVSGWAVLQSLKRDTRTQTIPVIMLTMTDSKEISLALGATDFLPKPLERSRLMDLLVKHVRHAGHPGQRPHVLVVEDDPVNRDLLKTALERENVAVSVAENGLVGLQRVAEKTPALIFLDLMMPVMDGFQFLDELRKRDGCRDIPVVTLTAVDLTNEQQNQLRDDVAVILDKKTLHPSELLRKIQNLVVQFVRKPEQHRDAVPTPSDGH